MVERLGKVEMNWGKMTFKFVHHESPVLLQGFSTNGVRSVRGPKSFRF